MPKFCLFLDFNVRMDDINNNKKITYFRLIKPKNSTAMLEHALFSCFGLYPVF